MWSKAPGETGESGDLACFHNRLLVGSSHPRRAREQNFPLLQVMLHISVSWRVTGSSSAHSVTGEEGS